MLLKNKIACVTGGTRGIGLAIVKTFLTEGARVALTGQTEQSAQETVRKLIRENLASTENLMALAPSLDSEEDLALALETIRNTWGHLDVMVNNAGIWEDTPFLSYSQESWEHVLNVDLLTVFACCRAAACIMKEQKSGVILNASSYISQYGQSKGAACPTAKAAINGLTKSLARELGPFNIRVNAISPGVIATDMVTTLPSDQQVELAKGIALGRLGQPEDVASAYAFLASDHARYISGAILPVDGAIVQ